MKFSEQDRFDGLDEKIRIYATADYGDDEAGGDGYEDNELFGDEEEEEVVVSMTLEQDSQPATEAPIKDCLIVVQPRS